MKLYTNEDNTVALKLIASAEMTGANLTIEMVNINDKRFQAPRRLPVLELDSGRTLFSSNSASFYLFPPSEELETSVSQWLDWEAITLLPAVVGLNLKHESSKDLLSALAELEKGLNSRSCLLDTLTVADVCIAATLYPIMTEDKMKNQYLSDKPNVTSWLDRVTSSKQFQAAVHKLNPKKGIAALQSVASSCWYPTKGDKNVKTEVQPIDEFVSEDKIAEAVAAYETPRVRGTSKRKTSPVLPVAGEKNVLVTSALPYVNNVPHLGNIIGCVLSGDVFARYCRARSWNTLYISGTDEYGTATETKALEEGLTPQQICDKYFEIHRDVYSWFNIGFDYFGRTTTPVQKEIVHKLFFECYENGFTVTDSVDQLLCEKCDRYLADRFVEGVCPDCKYEDARGDQCDGCGHLINAVELINPKCKQCRTTPIVKQSQQIFLDLPKLEGGLGDWVSSTSSGWSHIAQVITKAWLRDGLKPRCITRDLKWGIPVPLEGYTSKVFYVWFDAPIGYMSFTKNYTEDWLKWWKPDSNTKVSYCQFMAKDNVPFHSIMFPATILASKGGYTTVDHLYATEYLNYENGKFSKSRGIGIFGNDAKDTGIPSDIFRFYLLYIRPESQDSNFSWDDFATKNNSELLNNVGNFILRSLSFAEKFFGGKVPPVLLGVEEKQLLGHISRELNQYIGSLDKGGLRDGIKYILSMSRLGNQYMQSTQPWVLMKGSDEDKAKASTVIGLLCNLVCLISSLLQPYMPATVEEIAKQVKIPIEELTIHETFQPYLTTGHQIGKPSPLFTKIEQSVVESLKKRYAGSQKSVSPEAQPKLDLSKLDKSAAIKAVEEAITKQGNLVRSMKTAKKTKDELAPHIAALLDLKKQLSDLQLTKNEGEGDVSTLEESVAKQGNLVRELKSSGKSKQELEPEIAKLLNLKKQLAQAKGEPEETKPQGKSKSKKSK